MMENNIEQPSPNPDYLGHRKRLREKFIKSIELKSENTLQDYEILELLLFQSIPRGDVRGLAKKLIAKYGSLGQVLSADVNSLKQMKGVGEAVISAIKVALVCSLRLIKEEVKEKPLISSWKALIDYCVAQMKYKKIEEFHIFFFNTKNMLIADEVQNEGTINHTPVYPREIVKRALEIGAASIVLVHNHPSGDFTPSQADIDMTQKIQQATISVGIEVHDHLIIAGDKYFSFRNKGLL
jgi:DNA repair protein RadC